jgi:hypothetical protein
MDATETSIIELMAAADFRREAMGGNVEAWRRDIAQDHYVLVSFGDGEAFGPLKGDGWSWGSYLGDQTEDGASDYDSLQDCLTAAVGFCEIGA